MSNSFNDFIPDAFVQRMYAYKFKSWLLSWGECHR